MLSRVAARFASIAAQPAGTTTLFAVILAFVGLCGLVWGALQRFRAGRIAGTPLVPTGEAAAQGPAAAGARGAISVQGRVRCKSQVLSPVTRTPCLYYELKVTGSWQDGDRRQSRILVQEQLAARFYLDDGSGPVRVEADGGGDFEGLQRTFDETRREGFPTDLQGLIGKARPVMFGSYAFVNPSRSRADTFRCEERVLGLSDQLYACGKIDEIKRVVAQGRASLILSRRSRDELLGRALRGAHRFLIGGGAATGLGALLAMVATWL